MVKWTYDNGYPPCKKDGGEFHHKETKIGEKTFAELVCSECGSSFDSTGFPLDNETQKWIKKAGLIE